MPEPLVSILIPTYNGERFLAETVRSALAQTYRRIEVIVGDDASTDGTSAILAAAAGDDRLRVIRHERNLGPWDNPIRLVEEARGDYVKFLLHDDLLAPDCVEVLLGGMRSAKGVTLSFSHRAMIDEDGQLLDGRQVGQLAPSAGTMDGRHLGGVILRNNTNVIGEVTTCLFRRRDVDPADLWKIDGRRLVANADIALWLRLLSRGDAYYSPRTLSSFRLHGGQQTQKPHVIAGGARDWPLMIDWGRRHGFLPDAAAEATAQSRALVTAARVHRSFPDGPHSTGLLEAVFLATARLLELRTSPAADTRQPLTDRAHGSALLDRLTQELDVWAPVHPVAVAAPRPDAAEIGATVQAFRRVRDAGAAERFVLAVAAEQIDEVVPLIEAALAAGSDIDVDLVPTSAPAREITGPWLAVAPRGSAWHDGRATAVWAVDVPAVPCAGHRAEAVASEA